VVTMVVSVSRLHSGSIPELCRFVLFCFRAAGSSHQSDDEAFRNVQPSGLNCCCRYHYFDEHGLNFGPLHQNSWSGRSQCLRELIGCRKFSEC